MTEFEVNNPIARLSLTVAQARYDLLVSNASDSLSSAGFGPKTPIRKIVDYVEYALDNILEAIKEISFSDRMQATAITIGLEGLLGPEFPKEQVVLTTDLYEDERDDVLGATIGDSMIVFQVKSPLTYENVIETTHLINALAHEFYHMLQEKYGIEESVHAGAKYVNPTGKRGKQGRKAYLTNKEELQARVLPYVAQYIRDTSQTMDNERDYIQDVMTLMKRDDPEFYQVILGTPLEDEVERILSETYGHAKEELSAFVLELAAPKVSLQRCTAVTLNAIADHFNKPKIKLEEVPVYGTGVLEQIKRFGLKWNLLLDDSTLTISEFMKKHPTGVFYLSSAGHAMALVNGTLHDAAKGTGRRRLVSAIEVKRAGEETAAIDLASITDIYHVNKGNGVSYALRRQVDGLYLTDFKSEHKGNGYARAALEELTSLADQAGVPIMLEAVAGKDGLKQSQLEAFYQRRGFVNLYGSNRMVYRPKEQASVEEAANWMYHGTPATFDEFKVDETNYMVDRAIGVHFAADPVVSKRFVQGLYREGENKGAIGNLYRVRAPARSKILTVPQGRYGSDQHAIGSFVAATVFAERRDLFVRWIMRARMIDEAMGEEIYDLLKAGKAPADPKFGVAKAKGSNSFRSYMANFDGNLSMAGDEGKVEIVREFDRIMKKRGVEALVYRNTSPRELRDDDGNTIARSAKSYIILKHAAGKYKPEREESIKEAASMDELAISNTTTRNAIEYILGMKEGAMNSCYTIVSKAIEKHARQGSNVIVTLYGLNEQKIFHASVEIDGKDYNSASALSMSKYTYKKSYTLNDIIDMAEESSVSPLDKLQASMEAAKDDWWNKLTRAEQVQYLREHPKSKRKITSRGGSRPAPKEPAGKAKGKKDKYQVEERVFTGQVVQTKKTISKSETGKIGEKAIIDWLKRNGVPDAHELNVKQSNFPVDLIGDHMLIEAKTGVVSSQNQKWRATIGQPGKAETEMLKNMSAEEKTRWNQAKYKAIHDRKHKVLKDYEKELGVPVKARTMCTILNPDTKTFDLYVFEGFHHIITWKSEQAKQGYIGTFKYE